MTELPTITEAVHTKFDPFAGPEDSFTDSRPKGNMVRQASTLKHVSEGLGTICNDIDFVSIDVENSRASWGLMWLEGIITRLVHRVKSEGEGEEMRCSLCDGHDGMELIHKLGMWRVGWEEELVKRNDRDNGILKATRIGRMTIRLFKDIASRKRRN